jgi:hypothetical protein
MYHINEVEFQTRKYARILVQYCRNQIIELLLHAGQADLLSTFATYEGGCENFIWRLAVRMTFSYSVCL